MGLLVPAHGPPVGGLWRDVAAGETAQDVSVDGLGIVFAVLAGKCTAVPEQEPCGELGRRPVSLPGVILKAVGSDDAQVRRPDLPEALDQRRAGFVGGVDLHRHEGAGNGSDDRRLAVADLSQRRAAASSRREEVHQDKLSGRSRLAAGGAKVSGPPRDHVHAVPPGRNRTAWLECALPPLIWRAGSRSGMPAGQGRQPQLAFRCGPDVKAPARLQRGRIGVGSAGGMRALSPDHALTL
jgi:hypothetical protein